MNEGLVKAFESMGARVKIGTGGPRSWQKIDSGVRLNVLRDRKGEYFDVTLPEVNPPMVTVLNLDAEDRHLLLLVKEPPTRPHGVSEKSKFLLGHDERHWFVAAVPERAAVTVAQAKEALKPAEVRAAEVGLKTKHKSRRRNAARIRQGEWFFVPVKELPAAGLMFKNEPITRGRGKPHMCEELCRYGGETVYVNNALSPNGMTTDQYNALSEKDKKRPFRVMARNATVYAKGAVTHPDHATIILPGWHMVIPNTENRARGMEHVMFLD